MEEFMDNKLLLELKAELVKLKGQYLEVLNRPMSGVKKSIDILDIARNEVQIHSSAFFRNQMFLRLKEVNLALKAIEEGTYGICRVTGDLIPEKRLRAIPWSLTTVDAIAG